MPTVFVTFNAAAGRPLVLTCFIANRRATFELGVPVSADSVGRWSAGSLVHPSTNGEYRLLTTRNCAAAMCSPMVGGGLRALSGFRGACRCASVVARLDRSGKATSPATAEVAARPVPEPVNGEVTTAGNT